MTSLDADDQSITQQKTGQPLSSTTATLTPQSIPFLGFATEIRNHIYSYVAEDDSEIYIDEQNLGKLKSASTMAVLNKQVREEYISLLDANSPSIHAVVRDFDFSHVITFYNRLQEKAPRELYKDADALRTHNLTIHLKFTPDHISDPFELCSSEWFDFDNQPMWRGSQNGTCVDVHYRVTQKARAGWKNYGAWDRKSIDALFSIGHHWQRLQWFKIFVTF
jgi:hypothetical protein